MIRILACDPDLGDRSKLRVAVDLLVSSLGVGNCGIAYVAELDDLVDSVCRARPGFYDIVVCKVAAKADVTLPALRAIREADDALGIVILSDTSDYAVDAFDLHVDGYCLLQEGGAGFERAMKVPILKAASRHADTIGIKSDAGIGNVVVDEIQFVELSKKGPLFHLSDNRTLLTRGTLQSVYELLGDDRRFVKAGNSFIVNLDNVRSFGEGSIVFPDGEVIIVPVRVRKTMREQLDAYRYRPEFLESA